MMNSNLDIYFSIIPFQFACCCFREFHWTKHQILKVCTSEIPLYYFVFKRDCITFLQLSTKMHNEKIISVLGTFKSSLQKFTVVTMTWLTIFEYMCLKWPRICSMCRKHFPVLSSFMIYYRVCNLINTMGATSGTGTAYPSREPEFTPGFKWGSYFSVLSFICMCCCRSLFVLLYFFFWPLCSFFLFDINGVKLIHFIYIIEIWATMK